ncbi:hypothetical protein DV096_05820 [Bradymonadaceae bacterium TMQ3]|nr:hypothetical protein DV096_05820 [Bradymonadaceae bacterium TMQ3]TXC77180.1 hypothetical protein FRC91_00125 [Bradymonadales bacterium TMQ1]
MIVQCPSCSSRYRVNDANIPPSGGKIKCPSCAHAFVVYPEVAAEPEHEADKTSIAARPNIHELLNSMNQNKAAAQNAAPPVEDEVAKTEVMSGAELPDFSSMFGDVGGDQTIEMSNPLVSGVLPGLGASVEEDELHTQELSPDLVKKSLQHLGARPAGGPPSMPDDGGPATEIAPPPVVQQAMPGQRLSASAEPTPPPAGAPAFGTSPAVPQASGPSPGMTASAAPAGGVDGSHEGPWKLQTNFGLTYEFADNKSLRSWLASREELNGYKLSSGGEFFALSDYPQFSPGGGAAQRSGNYSVASSGAQAPMPGMGPAPTSPAGSGAAPAMTPPGAMPSVSGPAPTPAPPPASPFMTAGMPAVGQKPPATSEREKIDPNAGFRPPSRDSNVLTMVLWGVFGLLGLVAVALGLHLGGIINFPALGGIAPSESVAPSPAPTPAPAPADEAEAAPAEAAPAPPNPDRRVEVDRILDDARVDIESNRLTSALDRLETARMLDPDRVQIYDMSAQVHEKLGQQDKVEAMREQARKLRSQGGSPPPTME